MSVLVITDEQLRAAILEGLGIAGISEDVDEDTLAGAAADLFDSISAAASTSMSREGARANYIARANAAARARQAGGDEDAVADLEQQRDRAYAVWQAV